MFYRTEEEVPRKPSRLAAEVRRWLRVAWVACAYVLLWPVRAWRRAFAPLPAPAQLHRDPSLPMSRREALVYVQDLAVRHLREQVAGIKGIIHTGKTSLDRQDAQLVVEMGGMVIEGLERANESLMAEDAKVQVVDPRLVRPLGRMQ